MAKVYVPHEIQLREGVTAEDFERFVIEEWYPLLQPKGLTTYLLKGDRGRDEGKYLFMSEIESVERRDELIPGGGEVSEEYQRWFEAHAAVWEKLHTMCTWRYTHYVVVGK